MAKKQESEVETKPEAPKPVLAVEYNGNLYASMQSAEGARAKADLMPLLCTQRERLMYDTSMGLVSLGERQAVDAAIENAERVHGILSRYLAAKQA